MLHCVWRLGVEVTKLQDVFTGTNKHLQINNRTRSMADFYFRSGKEVVGPLTGIQLREAAFSGRVVLDTLVANSEQGPWSLALRVKGLFDVRGSPLPHPPDAEQLIAETRGAGKAVDPPPPPIQVSVRPVDSGPAPHRAPTPPPPPTTPPAILDFVPSTATKEVTAVCDNCGATNLAPATLSGVYVECFDCGELVYVPTARQRSFTQREHRREKQQQLGDEMSCVMTFLLP